MGTNWAQAIYLFFSLLIKSLTAHIKQSTNNIGSSHLIKKIMQKISKITIANNQKIWNGIMTIVFMALKKDLMIVLFMKMPIKIE
jgi:hypothetical protein